MFSALPGYELATGGSVVVTDPLWSNVVLALHGNGTNGATTIVDEKGRASPTSNRGTSAISTAQSKFDGASISFNHDGGLIYKTGAADAAFQLAGDFMIRCWVWASSGGASQTRVIFDSRMNGGSAGGLVWFIDSSNRMSVYSGTSYLTVDGTSFPLDQWVHVALTRSSGAFYAFKGGSVVTNGSVFTANLSDGRCCVGEVNPEYQGTTAMTGFIDDFEMANGQAVYTAAYTPPTTPFPNS